MAFAIAVAGKGGSGKTSLASLIIRYLKNNDLKPILAIDADANANLGDSLGLAVKQTVGSIIASFNQEKINIPPGMTKEAYLEYRLNEAIVESSGLDLITMGRGEGAECYCYPNAVLRKVADLLAANYGYVVMDNEAGMEHLSRRTTQNVDALLLVADHSIKGVRTIGRIKDLVAELKLAVKRQFVVLNFVPDGIAPTIKEELAKLGLEPAALIHDDPLVAQYDIEMKSLLQMPDTSVAVKAVNDLMAQVLNRERV
ncbi:MAG: AAA family ATPase [Chloroflexi bacterium]|nr:AAA family ATPase [Chloroflexota bacterium]